ncbi:MAG: metallophosphoesterase family protein [Isosphaeraceae bacterium]
MTTPEHSSSRIIHISDIHCTPHDYVFAVNWGASIGILLTGLPVGNPMRGDDQDTRSKCQELVTFLTSSGEMLRTDRIVITGDLVDSTGSEFAALAHQYLLGPLHAFGYDITLVPGNHDYFVAGNQFLTSSIAEGRADFFNAFSSYSKAPAPDAYPVDQDLGDGNHLILIDSLKGHYDVSTASHRAQGNIGAQQLNWLRAILPTYQESREGGTKVVLALHHNPFDTEGDTEITDAAEFLGVIAGRVDALMFGHTGPPHHFYLEQVRDYKIPVITSENIDKMSGTGYPVSVIDLNCNQVEVYSTRSGLLAIEGSPAYSYGTRGEAALITTAVAAAVVM